MGVYIADLEDEISADYTDYADYSVRNRFRGQAEPGNLTPVEPENVQRLSALYSKPSRS
jgi:hypothetical protein